MAKKSTKSKKPKKPTVIKTNNTSKIQIYVYGNPIDCINILENIQTDNLDDMKYNVVACCYNDSWLIGSSVLGVPYISINELVKHTQHNPNYYVIHPELKYTQDIKDILINKNIIKVMSIGYLMSHKITPITSLNSLHNFNKSNTSLYIASPLKTGNVTLAETFYKNNLDFIGLMHQPIRFRFLNYFKNAKVITAVREPIIQMLSLIYYSLTAANCNNPYFDILTSQFESKEQFSQSIDSIYPIFNRYNESRGKLADIFYTDLYMERFNKHIINLYNHDFDKEKGYSIIKQGNIEVFVYQLEKMNDIATEMSDWIGQTPFDTWIRGNETSSKWVADHYKLAQKEIKFSQEFFDDCYNQQWVQHFYSQEDIEKFKERWRPHII